MTDNFTLFDEPRRPWLDAKRLKEKFLALSAQAHPDRQHGAAEAVRNEASRRFSELNAAYNCLRDPKERLRHLLELELGAKPKDIERIPGELLEYFAEVGNLGRNIDAFLLERANVTSPILEVQWFERGQDWTDKINALQNKLNTRLNALDAELKALNPVWKSTADRSALPLDRLEAIYRLLGYFGRWTAQLQERLVRLAI